MRSQRQLTLRIMQGRKRKPSLYLVALATLFSGLLLSTAALPTLLGVASGKVIATQTPVEEEHQHGREVLKQLLHDHRSWAGSTQHLDQCVKTYFCLGDEAVPAGPVAEVPLQPPRTV
ncbi:MAG: hypothetical protein KF843_11550 [Flavobacteriales bacterium]|jgi:hypothetical protein|nr:hypothetical protein [Flavobacteriales bacterium]